MALLAVVGCQNANKETTATAEGAEATAKSEVGAGDIAYVRTDVIAAQCDLFKSEGVALQSKNEKTQQSLAQKEQKLQNELIQLQEKYQKGLITTIEAQRKEQDLQKRIEAYQKSAQEQVKALEEENVVFSNRAQDLMRRAVSEVNADKKYKMVVNATALLDAAEALDISDAVLAKVNELYAADKTAETTASKE